MGQLTILGHRRFFTPQKTKAYDQLKWAKRDSIIINPLTGETVFEQSGIEFPELWSQNAIDIVAQKYFTGTPKTAGRENSLKHLVDRVVDTITRQGVQDGYFESDEEAEDFREELKFVLASQRAAFNSPVWFNIGVPERVQQASACFILAVEDTMTSILNWYLEEGMIFKGGSGSGINLSNIRSSYESLDKSAGTASGPVSFMRGADASAGAIKSGGKIRRAAKMVILDADHPDVEDFIWSKAIEERKARVLENAGFDMELGGKDTFSLQYQNANNSIRVTDEFMEAVIADKDYALKTVKDKKKVIKTVKARDLFREIAEAAWESADPGIQFDTTINKWNTTPNAGRINASNPYSEYMHLDNSACNLASINLIKYLNDDNSFDIEGFRHTVELMFTAQEILVGYSEYPTANIGKTTKAFRQLGLGYANLGALLMAQGLAYDSDEGRAQAAAITALMTGHAYATSARIANRVGPFNGFHKDRDNMLKIIKMHRKAVSSIDASLVSEELLSASASSWDDAVELSELYGVRNAQASLLAPTITIGLTMDCDTPGMEPDSSLIKEKKLAGSGDAKSIINQAVPTALKVLGYNKQQIDKIVEYVDQQKSIIGAPELKEGHESVFACSVGDNAIHYMGHVKMMSAVQPFLSGAIGKTVSMPEDVTIDEVEQLNIDSWKLGLKAIAIYRENCKVGQPLITSDNKGAEDKITTIEPAAAEQLTDKFILAGAVRKELPRLRQSKTFSLTVSGSHGYLTVGEYADGTPGEIFVNFAKHGSTLRGIMDAFAMSVSHGLQYGVPLKTYVKSFMNTSFSPAGITDDPDIRTASSLVDFVARRLALTYLSFEDLLELGLKSIDDMDESMFQTSLPVEGDAGAIEPTEEPKPKAVKHEVKLISDDNSPLCYNCGNTTQRSGTCYVCTSCGSTTGCS